MWLCLGASVIRFVWLGGACVVEQSSEQGGVLKVCVCIKMSNDMDLKVFDSALLRKAKNTCNFL